MKDIFARLDTSDEEDHWESCPGGFEVRKNTALKLERKGREDPFAQRRVSSSIQFLDLQFMRNNTEHKSHTLNALNPSDSESEVFLGYFDFDEVKEEQPKPAPRRLAPILEQPQPAPRRLASMNDDPRIMQESWAQAVNQLETKETGKDDGLKVDVATRI